MALITRLSRLFTADVHAVLDRIEEPEVLLKQAIREMGEDLATGERRIRWINHELAQIGRQETELRREVQAGAAELDTCFAAQQEDLARRLIRRGLEAEARLKAIVNRRVNLAAELAERQTGLHENRSRYEHLKQKAELLAETPEDSGGQEQRWNPVGDAVVRDEDVELAFLREKQKRSRT